MIETIAAATSVLVAATGRIPRSRPMLDRMKENSPIWPRAMAMVSAVLKEYPSTRTVSSAISGLPTSTTASVAAISPGASSR